MNYFLKCNSAFNKYFSKHGHVSVLVLRATLRSLVPPPLLPLLPILRQVGLVHELCAKSGSLLASYMPLLIPDLGKRREKDLAPALLELMFQLRKPTNACEIIRERYLAIEIECESTEGIQKKATGCCGRGFVHMGNLQKVCLGREIRSGLAERRRSLAGLKQDTVA